MAIEVLFSVLLDIYLQVALSSLMVLPTFVIYFHKFLHICQHLLFFFLIGVFSSLEIV